MPGLWEKTNTEMVLASEVILEILKRAKSGGEGVSAFESEANVREEVIRRGVKAGTCNSEGGPVSSGKIRSFGGLGKNNYNLWPRDEVGNLID